MTNPGKYQSNNFKQRLQSWLPTTSPAFIFELVVLVYLIAAVVTFCRSGNESMFNTLLSYVSAYVGLVKVKPLLPWVGRGNEGSHPPDAE